MRNILAIIKRFYVFLIFLALQAFALVLLYKSSLYHHSEMMQQANDAVGEVYSRRASLSEYLRLGEINDALSLENAQLRSQLPENYLLQRTDVDSIGDTLALARYTYRTAKVINASVNREKNFVLIDRGTDGGVTQDMGVISNGAIVGVVRSTSQHFSVVMPVLHADFKASVRLKRSGVVGSMIWPGGNPAVANVIEIPKNIPVEVGDTVITSGYSDYFPANLLAGTVIEINDEDNDFHLIRIQLGADFRKLDHVLVISDIFKEELQQLTQQVQTQDAANNP